MVIFAANSPAIAFDVQGHRCARGLAPENTIEGFRTALSIGVTTLELDIAMTKDGILVIHHDERFDPDITRGPEGAFLAHQGPAIYSLTLEEVKRYDVGRLKPGTALAARFPEQRPSDGKLLSTRPSLTNTRSLRRLISTSLPFWPRARGTDSGQRGRNKEFIPG
jgi:glycerophosphoryl diester phosphodiesterase